MAAGSRAMKLAWLWNEIDFEVLSDGKGKRIMSNVLAHYPLTLEWKITLH